MAKLIVVQWRDIPAQVIVKNGRESARMQLSERFQVAIDRAAMRAGKSSSKAYLEDWRQQPPRVCGNDLEAEALAEARRIEASYSDAALESLIRAKGLASGGAGN